MVNLENLSAEQLAELKAQIENKEKADAERVQRERENYKDLVDATVRSCVSRLQKLSSEMQRIKQETFAEFDTLIKTKDELFKTKSDRNSDTFTTSDGEMSLTLGNRVNEGWDDTVEVGIKKVKEFLTTLAKDDNSAMLVQTVMSLLTKDRKGNLRAAKVLELRKLAEKSNNPDFLDGLKIIEQAYRPQVTCQFIQVEVKDQEGKMKKVPLSLSSM